MARKVTARATKKNKPSKAQKRAPAVKPVSKAAKRPAKAAQPAAKTVKQPVKKTLRPTKAAKRPAKAAQRLAKPAKTKVVQQPAKKTRATDSSIPKVPVPPGVKITPNKYFTVSELAFFRNLLLQHRDRRIDGIQFLASDALTRSQRESTGNLSGYSVHMADHGTDNFDREFAVNLVSGEQGVLNEINAALYRIEQGTYGICEGSGKPIEKERLKVLPYARYCVAEQSERERGKPRFRPFARTSIQTAEPTGDSG